MTSRPPSDTEFARMFNTEFDFVVSSLRRLGVHDGDLPDVAQEVFVSVHKRLSSFDKERRIRPWLFGFARRAAANYRRLSRHTEQQTLQEPADMSVHRVTQQHESTDLVHRTLLAMPEKRRVVLMMADLYQFEAGEIAEQLDIPLGTVYSRVRRAREEFRALAASSGRRSSVRLKGESL